MTEKEVPWRSAFLSLSLLSRAVDLLRDLLSDIANPSDHRRGQIEQWLYEAERILE